VTKKSEGVTSRGAKHDDQGEQVEKKLKIGLVGHLKLLSIRGESSLIIINKA
jgi:hypothetical protein